MDKLLKDKILRENYIWAFCGALISGFAAYMFMITHHFLTFDSVGNQFASQDVLYLGRQFLTYACGISSYYDLPWVNGVLAILYLAILSVFMVELFEVKDKYLAGLMGGVLVTFPSVISTFCYTYTLDGYMLAALLSVIAVFITVRFKYGFAPGAILMCLSLGIYQAYYAVAICLCAFVLIQKIYTGKEIKELVRTAVNACIMGVVGYFLYVVTLKITLKVKGVDLTGYQGTDKVMSFDFANLGYGLKQAIYKFKVFIMYENVLSTFVVMKIAVLVIALTSVILFVYLFIKMGAYKKWYNYILTALLVGILPFGATVVVIMAPDNFFHTLQKYGFATFFVFAVVLVSDTIKNLLKSDKIWKILGKLSACAMAVLVFCFIVMANIVGFQMNERYEKSYAIAVRMVDRLEQTPGYHTGDKVALLGGNLNADNYPETAITREDLVGYFGANGDLSFNSADTFMEFCKHYLGVTLGFVSPEKQIELTGYPEFQEMGNFPAADSIRQIEDIWVIRING